MLFRSQLFDTTWDTWMYYYEGKYYLYYLITESTPGEGFGVAVSDDAITFKDYGKQIGASDNMVVYLGTGSVWKDVNFEKSKMFICNYSEWRQDKEGRNVQNILFATSYDLIHWEKLGDKSMFSPDEKMYKQYETEGGRWDCIFPLKSSFGYYGYYTATPKDYLGCGLAKSCDGIKFEAQKPPRFRIEEKNIREGIEVGGVCVHNNKYYMLMGTYVNEYGIAVLTSDTESGDFVPQKKNFGLLANGSFMHAYFMRLFSKDDELLVNHHVLLRKVNEFNRNVTYFAPLKKVTFTDETLRLMWYKGNDKLKGAPIKEFDGKSQYVVEGEFGKTGKITLALKDGLNLSVNLSKDGIIDISENDKSTEHINKDMIFKEGKYRLLIRGTLLELYIDDFFITCYTLKSEFEKLEEKDNKIKIWEMKL